MQSKYCAVICEYNPLHNGHAFLFEQAKALTGCARVLCLMSGNFTQRGEFACADKFTRATWAIRAGAAAVFELPTVFACAPAPDFALGAIRLLSSLPFISHLCFGSESGDIQSLYKLAQDTQKADIKALLRAGHGYSGAFSRSDILSGDAEFTSNNILAAEYIKNLHRLKSHIIPLTVKRTGAEFNCEQPQKQAYCSASAVRAALKRSNLSEVLPHIPTYVRDSLQSIYGKNAAQGNSILACADDRYFSMLSHALLTADKARLQHTAYHSGGIAARTAAAAGKSYNLEQLIAYIDGKHLSVSKIRRFLTAFLLGITQEDIAIAKTQPPYLRVLAIAADSHDILSLAGNYVRIIARYADYKKVETDCIRFDVLSSDIYFKLFAPTPVSPHGESSDFGNILCNYVDNISTKKSAPDTEAQSDYSRGLNIISNTIT